MRHSEMADPARRLASLTHGEGGQHEPGEGPSYTPDTCEGGTRAIRKAQPTLSAATVTAASWGGW